MEPTQTFNPIAFSGSTAVGYHGLYRPFRRVHLALDVNEGETLCGLDIAYVEQAGEVRISVPTTWTAMDACGTCIARKNGR